MQVHELKENVTREALEKRIEKHKPALIAFNGHGSPDCITGDNLEILVKAGENENILQSAIVHSLSCSSASILGPRSVKAGAKAFIGYNQDFVLLHSEDRSTTPKKDRIAEHFLTAANLAPISLIKGNTVQDAYEKSQAAYEKSIEYYMTHYTPQNSHILFWLRYNKTIQEIHGAKNATLISCQS
ncbi:MAG: hypothetical protein HY544_03910 [Candidatus Diapherotrites archaeon]|uniref:CHAT domain-containing protein n=1 Tax=Candidatus Iainarchaeum sp. TaxID=3101447 RepID=A0A8T3YK52_9ARCH|nr:hypothetical protein [Candidatus Diapherotrites archaeon]